MAKLPTLLRLMNKIVMGAAVLLALGAGTTVAEDVAVQFSFHQGGGITAPRQCEGTGQWNGTHFSATCHSNEMTAEFSGELSGNSLTVQGSVFGLGGWEGGAVARGTPCPMRGSLYPASGRVTVQIDLLCLPSAFGRLVLDTPRH